MVTMVGGIIALILGIIGIIAWYEPFLTLVMGVIPVILILGGALAAYLGIEEWKDQQTLAQTPGPNNLEADVEKYKAEAEKYKAEAEKYKSELAAKD